MNQSSSQNNPHPPPPSGGDRQHGGGGGGGGGGGEFYQGGEGGRRRPYPATSFASDEREHNTNNMHFNDQIRGGQEYSADGDGGRSGNNWGQQGHNQHQQYHGSPPPNFRGGRGGGRGRGGGGFQPSSDQYNQRNGQHHQQHRSNDPQKPLPPDQRRTLVLANVPPQMTHHHIKPHFLNNWGIPVEYAHVDKHSGLAYVRFQTVDDAKQIWALGTNGLDGPNSHNAANDVGGGGGGGGVDEQSSSSSFVSEGIVLQEVYFTNYVPNNEKKYDDNTQSSSSAAMSRKHGRGVDEYGAGGFSHHSDERDSKMSRRHSGQNYPTQQYGCNNNNNTNIKPTPSYTNPSNNSYSRTSEQQKRHQPTPEELELKKQKHAEYQKQYEAFQKEEQEWRKRRNAEYQTFATTKNERTAQISTLQQKKDLQSKQETMLAKQLPLHKKMLSMLKSKNASASEQSKKMKEILSAQTQLLALKKDMKNTVEELEKLKEEERVKGVFVPSEKRPVFVAPVSRGSGGVQKRSLDRRSTVLRVAGFGDGQLDEETMKAELKDHFSAFGAVSDVSLVERDNNVQQYDDDDDVPASLCALVHFSTRLDAEKAKESGANFKEISLKCSWYHESSSSTRNDDGNDAEGDTVDAVGGGAEESNFHNDLYGNDAEVEESYGDFFAEEGLPAGEEHDMVDYDYGGDDDMVDYD